MKIHPALKKVLTRSLFLTSLSLIACSLALPAQAGSFTVDGVETDWAPVSNKMTVNDVAGADTLVNVNGINSSSTLVTGYAASGDVSGNTVNVNNSQISNVYGSQTGSHAYDNHVNLTSSTSSSFAIGAYILTATGKATDNTFSATDCTLNNVYGVYINGGEADGNSLSIKNSSASKNIMGVYVNGDGQANNNSVTVDNSTAASWIYAVRMQNGTAEGSATNKASGNSLTIQNASELATSVLTVYAANANLNHNTLTIKDSTIKGQAVASLVYDGKGDATHNTLILENASVLDGDDVVCGWANDGDANHNTVILKGGIQINTNYGLWGGKNSNSGKDCITGNSLTMEAVTGYVKAVNNFDTIEQKGGSVTIGSGVLSAATSVCIKGAVDGAAAALTSGTNNLTVSAGQTLDITNAELSTTGAVTLSSDGNVVLDEVAVSGSDISISGNISLGSATLEASKSITITGAEAAASPAQESGASEGDLSISGGKSVDISTINLGSTGTVTISGEGSIALKDMSISAANVAIAGTGNAASRTLENVDITVAAGGTVDLRNTTISGSSSISAPGATVFTLMPQSDETITVLLEGSTVVLNLDNSTVEGADGNYTIDASSFFDGLDVQGSFTLDITVFEETLSDFESIEIQLQKEAVAADSLANVTVVLGEQTYVSKPGESGNSISFGPTDVIPEPTTATLSLLALAALAARRRRK